MVQRALVICINICIDIGAHILSFNKNVIPETYSPIFELLDKKGIITEQMEKNLFK
ncbi:MAG: DUF86 domain-containing protein [Candidatus Lokiarchaeota archaeon]|nr:DUF86 domain-containing protein [Candidatus Lokiarchaeota archaeon]MBD3339045.1 DUF86 domain-containing protein [Candidatus Lokiarchaeota archaeon]